MLPQESDVYVYGNFNYDTNKLCIYNIIHKIQVHKSRSTTILDPW